MVYYILKPREDFLKRVEESGSNLDMILEGKVILGMLTDDRKGMKESIDAYLIRVPEQRIEFKLKTTLDGYISDFLVKFWEIETK